MTELAKVGILRKNSVSSDSRFITNMFHCEMAIQVLRNNEWQQFGDL